MTDPPQLNVKLDDIATERTAIARNKGLTTTVTNGATTPLVFPFSFKDSTQFGSNFGIGSARQDGYAPGELAGFSVSPEGRSSALYQRSDQDHCLHPAVQLS